MNSRGTLSAGGHRVPARVINWLSSLYGLIAVRRRAWFARRADRRRRLDRPVISVGNLSLGGSGKTPVVAAVARWLLTQGEHPSILSRGYGRRVADEGVVVVSDRERVRERVSRSGDEPQMLARALPGVPVLVCADRYLAGRLAERQFGSTVHLLDDGFQHLPLMRDVDLLLVSLSDLDDLVVPAGRLREPLRAATVADAVLVNGDDDAVSAVSKHLGVSTAFRVETRFAAPRLLQPYGALLPPMAGARALAVAGIARPERFFDAVRRHGWEVVKEIAFRDHHWFDQSDLKLMLATARAVHADVILTTEKDAVRLLDLPVAPIPRTFAFLPMEVDVEPKATFERWLHDTLEAARADAGSSHPPVGRNFSSGDTPR